MVYRNLSKNTMKQPGVMLPAVSLLLTCTQLSSALWRQRPVQDIATHDITDKKKEYF